MKVNSYILRAVLAVFLSVTFAGAQQRAWDRYSKEYEPLLETRQYDRALRLAVDALKELEAEYGRENTRVAVLRMRIGMANIKKSDFAKAEEVLTESVAIFEEIMPANHALVIESQWWLSEALFCQEKYDPTITLLTKTLQAAEMDPRRKTRTVSRGIGFSGRLKADKIFGPSGEWVIRITERIGQCFRKTDRYNEAVAFLTRNVEALEAHYDKDHPKAAAARMLLDETKKSAEKSTGTPSELTLKDNSV